MEHPRWVCPKHAIDTLEVLDDSMRCRKGCTFPIMDGIPRFVSGGNYASAFGLQWRKFRLTQLDSCTGIPLSETRLDRCLNGISVAGKTVLEVGCGAGRFTEVLLKRGALVTSIDLSDAVDANQQNFPQNAAHRIAQADVNALPFPGDFDIVLCLGVIQHTPHTEATIRALWEQVKPGGHLVIDHYTYNLSHFTKTAPLFRMVMKRLSPEGGLHWTLALVDNLYPVHRAVRRYPLLQMLLSRISPVQVYFRHYPDLSDKWQYQWALLDTHDTLTDWYKRFRTVKSIRATLQALGAGSAQVIRCEKGGNGVEALAHKLECPLTSLPPT